MHALHASGTSEANELGCGQVLEYIRSLGAFAVRGNQDDKALKDWLQWKAGEPLVGFNTSLPATFILLILADIL